jgi:hypothetical protein
MRDNPPPGPPKVASAGTGSRFNHQGSSKHARAVTPAERGPLMARRRGFRLWEFSVHLGMTRPALDFTLPGKPPEHLSTHLQSLTHGMLLGQQMHVPPHLRHFFRDPADIAAEADSRDSLFEVRDLAVTGRRLRITYRTGGFGNYEAAVPRGRGREVDVRRHALTNDQRVLFLFPEEGRKGLMIAESVRGTSGEETLLRWLHAASMFARDPDPHWRIRARRVADPEHLANLIKADALDAIVLHRRDQRGTRATTTEPFTVRAPIKTAYVRRMAARTLVGWRERDAPLSAQQGARELAAILDSELADIPFEDGYVRASADGDAGQQLRPDFKREMFTYLLPGGRLDDDEVVAEARAVANRIAGLSDLPITW